MLSPMVGSSTDKAVDASCLISERAPAAGGGSSVDIARHQRLRLGKIGAKEPIVARQQRLPRVQQPQAQLLPHQCLLLSVEQHRLRRINMTNANQIAILAELALQCTPLALPPTRWRQRRRRIRGRR